MNEKSSQLCFLESFSNYKFETQLDIRSFKYIQNRVLDFWNTICYTNFQIRKYFADADYVNMAWLKNGSEGKKFWKKEFCL